MKILVALFVVGLFAGADCNGQKTSRNQTWTKKLQTTPVAKIEAGLPQKPFNQWLVELTRSEPKYEMSDCETSGSSATGECITVTADTAPMRRVELTFAVPAERSVNAGEGAVCTFVRGSVGPSDPRMKAPTRIIRKLSELEKLLGP